MTFIADTGRAQRSAALLLTLGMVLTVGTALAFQHIGGYIPCKLCLEQRLPYYIGAPLMALALISSVVPGPAWLTRGLLIVGGVLMLWSLYLGAFHAGVEWGWWQGPTDCGAVAAPAALGGNGILDQLNSIVPPSCNEAALRVLGLSFAGWNVVASVALGAIAFWGALKR
jgi:disulfide bond formation protein DsbB